MAKTYSNNIRPFHVGVGHDDDDDNDDVGRGGVGGGCKTTRQLIHFLFLFIALTALCASILFGIFHQRIFTSFTSFGSFSYLSSLSLAAKNMSSDQDQVIKQLEEELAKNPLDPNSFARADQAKVKHLHLDLSIDPRSQVLVGTVRLDVVKVQPNASVLLLDTVDLEIFTVALVGSGGGGKKVPFKLYSPVPEFGAKLELNISSIVSTTFQVEIGYRTSPKARALQWLSPEQTDGKKYPYMFSQCEAINARSMVPCQDTPSVKATYSASISAPKELTVLMSAKRMGSPTDDGAIAANRVHRFDQPEPIPSYLIAIVAGELVSRQIGTRSHVWSEPSLIERSAWEFAEIDSILATAEEIAGPYVWGIYDLLILPPSFPFGGMENPCLTFVTPTLLAGDRSLVNVVAHEIAHSWTGNLVTNQNFEHFWLNEGFTTFLEYKIVGRRAHGERTRQFMALEGLKELRQTIESMGVTNPRTKLVTDLRGVNPDDAFSVVPYKKGHTFLFYLEQQLGGPTVFEPFLRSYIQHFKGQSIVTEQFRQYLLDYFNQNGTAEQKQALSKVEWDAWLFTPGYPHIVPDFDRTLLNASVELAQRWINATDSQVQSSADTLFSVTEYKTLESGQKKLFYIELLERTTAPGSTKLSTIKLDTMVRLYNLNNEHNAEVQCSWLVLALNSHYQPAVKDAVEFVQIIGRVKFIRPIYRALFHWENTKQLALDTFAANREHMMSLATLAISAELGVKS